MDPHIPVPVLSSQIQGCVSMDDSVPHPKLLGELRLRKVQMLGWIVKRVPYSTRRGAWVEYSLDDGSGGDGLPCTVCTKWFRRAEDSLTEDNAELDVFPVDAEDDVFQPGCLVEVRGGLQRFRGEWRLRVERMALEKDPNRLVLFWQSCYALLVFFRDPRQLRLQESEEGRNGGEGRMDVAEEEKEEEKE